MADLHPDVVVIGAGPAGAVAATLLARRGHTVRVLERQRFPRFSIGESLLAHCLDFLEEADMSRAVHAAGFQFKNGAEFVRGEERVGFNFAETFGAGYPYAFQVPRARFDQILADEAARQGADVRYEEEILDVDLSPERPTLVARDASGRRSEIEPRFVLDASGFGRTLPRLLGLETPSTFPVRRALFTHVEDRIAAGAFDRQKIRVTVHPRQPDVWFWLIPFSNGRASLGVVGRDVLFDGLPGGPGDRLRTLVAEDAGLARLLRDAVWDTPVNELRGYAANVKAMHGPGFALLGNAAEFLDPVFSSGVTIALKSASLAVRALDRQLRGEAVDWEAAFAAPLRRGVDAFRTYVNAWYDGRFQTVIFHPDANPQVKSMICSVLAGYAWDERNPFAADSERRLQAVYELCRGP